MRKVFEALKDMGAFFETNICSIRKIEEIVEDNEANTIIAVSFSKRKNNPVFVMCNGAKILYAKRKVFDLTEKKIINELKAIEKLFKVKVEDGEEELIFVTNESEFTYDGLHEQKICGGTNL